MLEWSTKVNQSGSISVSRFTRWSADGGWFAAYATGLGKGSPCSARWAD